MADLLCGGAASEFLSMEAGSDRPDPFVYGVIPMSARCILVRAVAPFPEGLLLARPGF